MEFSTLSSQIGPSFVKRANGQFGHTKSTLVVWLSSNVWKKSLKNFGGPPLNLKSLKSSGMLGGTRKAEVVTA